jgi:transcriptional regulator with XRE-family HTH domain
MCIQPGNLASVDPVALRIQSLLDEHGWTPYELSKRAGLSDSHVQLILKRGTKRLGRVTLEKIAAGAGVSARWLVDGEGSREPSAPTEVRMVPEDSDPRMRNREGYDRHLSGARALRPGMPGYVWDAIGDGDPLVIAPLTPAMLADIADVLVKYIPPPPGHTPSRRG